MEIAHIDFPWHRKILLIFILGIPNSAEILKTYFSAKLLAIFILY